MAEVYNPVDRDRHPPALAQVYKSSVTRSPRFRPLPVGGAMGSVTGPVFGHHQIAPTDSDLLQNFSTGGDPVGERIVIHGRVLDENARPVPGTLIEVWQANAGGRYAHVNDGYLAALDPNFGGCGRCLTDADGRYEFQTVRPGPYPFPNWQASWRPAHVHFSVFGAAFAQRLITQMYFEGDPLIPLCPIVATIPDARAVDQLVARLDMENSRPFDALAYRFDIVLRGRGSTMFENRTEGN